MSNSFIELADPVHVKNSLESIFSGDIVHLQWYLPWILRKICSDTASSETADPSTFEGSMYNTGSISSRSALGALVQTATLIRTGSEPTIESIADALKNTFHHRPASAATDDQRSIARLSLAFCILSCLTFLYEPQPTASEQVFRIVPP
ncbi:unnamed protein product [Clonostachys rhizophaga]|uniref:Uncharacterized protein n=1 Tax=Clonostachys rhizophaga TaxID=160324 RepID=A0A9N9YQ17_9HYPO|nr:unnamed protein product [Clonostachys rhizophaga]